MSKFNQSKLINALTRLGQQLSEPGDDLLELINNEKQFNAWFTPESVQKAVLAIGASLNGAAIESWLSRYNLKDLDSPKNIGLILAGNIPLVGFHDALCVLVSGNNALIKASSQDARLIKFVLEKLSEIETAFANRFKFVERLTDFDAIIATGSNNSSRYFDYYFGKVPNIIRKNRNSIAVLTGNETADQLKRLGNDIFTYYGLGCRNVSKLLVPDGYNFNFFFESIENYQPIINHHKYNNNYDYNKSIYLVNSDQHLDNGFLLLKKDERLASPLAVLFYQNYTNLEDAQNQINEQSAHIQCVVSKLPLATKNQVVDFGKSQQPDLWDYADGVDTLTFLQSL